MTITVGVHEAKTRLSELIRLVGEGTEVVITNRGEAVARLARPIASRPRELGFDRGRFVVPDDFDAPLPAELQEHFE